MDRFVTRLDSNKRPLWDESGRTTVVELFAGCGGMALALEQLGMRHLALVERDKNCVQTLRKNGFDQVVHSDANCVNYSVYKGADLVVGGPPCQPFSNGGQGGGREDERDGWPIAIRAVKEIQPRGFLFENVAGFCRDKFKDYVDGILAQLWELGYSVHLHSIDAADYGVPQYRRRVLMIGIKGVSWFQAPKPQEHEITVREALASLGPPNGLNGHDEHPVLPRSYPGHTGSVWDRPSKTVVAGANGQSGGSGMITLDDESLRYFTVRELARIQTFPDTFKLPKTWSHAVKQLGNACPPLLIKQFAKELEYRINRVSGKCPQSPSLKGRESTPKRARSASPALASGSG